MNKIKKIKRIVGVSVGSIIGLLYVAGYSIDEISKVAIDTDFLHQATVINIKDIFEKKGLFSQKSFELKLKQLLKDKFGFVPNLQQLFEFTDIEFTCVVTNIKLDIQSPEYFSHKNHPYLSCVEAVLMSSNIPLIFEKKEYKNGIYIDGALSDPYPVDIYDDGINNILAISVFTPPKAEINFMEYIMRGIYSPIVQLREIKERNQSDKVKHLKIPVNVNASLGLFSDGQQKELMYLEGFKYAQSFFDKPQEKIINNDVIIDFE